MSNKENIPIWKKDFPIKQEDAMNVSRREFAKFLTLFSGSLALGNGILATKSTFLDKEANKSELLICSESELPEGNMRAFSYQEMPYILLHLADDQWRAFEQKCTHLSCAVYYNDEEKKIVCPCHKGYFDPLTGAVLAGPPPRSLHQLEVVRKEGKIFVTEKQNHE